MTEPVSPAHGIERFSNEPLTAARGTESVNEINRGGLWKPIADIPGIPF